MHPFAVISILLLLWAVAWAAYIAVRAGDWRLRVLAGLLAAVAVGHLVSVAFMLDTWRFSLGIPQGALSDLGVAAIVVLTVYLVDRVVTRHRRVERAYGVEKAYLEGLFESSPEAIALFDNDGRTLRVNKPFTELFGYRTTDIVGRSLDDELVPPELMDEAVALTQRTVAGERISVETVRQRKDGSRVDVSILGAPVRGPGGQIAVIGIYHDITARKQAELAFLRLQKAVETTQLGVTVTDLRGKIIYTNPADAAMHGYEVDELLGQDIGVFAPGGTRRPMSTDEVAAMGSWQRETRNARKDGSVFPVHLMSDVVRDESGKIVSIVTTCEDITRRKEAEQALRESEERYALAAQGANDGLWDWEIVQDRVYYSERWKSILGYAGDEIPPHIDGWLERVHPDDLERTKGELDAHLAGETDHYENEHRMEHKDGSYRWVLMRGIAIRNPEGDPLRMAGSLTDITPRKSVEEQLARDALYDPLTGLPNRAFFANLLERAARRSRRRRKYQFAVLFLDLDRFKVINDSLGHDVGDQLLQGVAERLEKALRPGDVVARLAGDEFCILLDDITGSPDATRVAERVLEALADPFMLSGHRIFASASIGIATSETAAKGPEHLLRDADTAMYRAKSRGKSRFEVFDQAMHQRAMEVLDLESDIRRALEEGQFRLEYQSIERLGTREIAGFEALVRWEHPERGLVTPADFVPIAEETGLIVPLGLWVLHEACRQMAEWKQQHPERSELFVSINVSRKQIQQVDLVERIRAELGEFELEPHRLTLEIAETVLMEDPDFHLTLVEQLAEIGVAVHIDNFGTGYSSLSYLNDAMIRTLKVDRSLVGTLGGAGSKLSMLQAVVALAHDLGIQVVAQGVETAEQIEGLVGLECDAVQGFFYSKPMDAAAATALLRGSDA
ncbi:MAG: EAL domain-containing protein [Gemmatimonadales bacterium]|jgi:diguanylate cyclase (GGDEF)-like protein/PAS domain S-box-containing protein